MLSEVKNKIISVCEYLKNNGFLISTEGNISTRIDNNKIVITPKRKDKKNLKPSDLVVIDLNGKKLLGKNQPSGEWRVHSIIYKLRPEIKAVIHTHPVYTTALSLTNFNINIPVLPEIIFEVGKISLVEYAPFYTEELAENLKKYIKDSNAFILKNHGLITIGTSLEEALVKTEKVEYLCKVLFIANSFGKITYLSKKQVGNLLKLVNKT